MSLAITLEAMIAADCTREQMLAVVQAHEAIAKVKLTEKRVKDAERQRKSRMSRGVTVTPCDSNGHDATHNTAHAHAPEEVLTSLDSSKSFQRKTPLKGGPKKGFKTQVSEDVQPTEKDRAVAERMGMSEATFWLEWEKWRGHHISEAKPVANLHQSWVKWCSNWVSYGRRQADKQPRAGPSRGGNGFSDLLDELKAKRNGEQSPSDIKDITPASPEPRAGDFAAQLHEPTGKSSGGGEILDFRSASFDLRRSAAPHSEAARAYDWPEPFGRSWDRSGID